MKNKILIIAVILILVFIPTILDKINQNNFEKEFNQVIDLRKEIIEKIKNNELNINESGKVELPKKYSSVAANNYVKVYVCDDNETVIAFLYEPGFPDQDEYIFYSSSNEELIKKYLKKELYSSIEEVQQNWYIVQYN